MRALTLVLAAGALLWGVTACNGSQAEDDGASGTGGAPRIPASNADRAFFPPGTQAEQLVEIVREGLSVVEKGPDVTRFVIIRAGDRHGPAYREALYHVVVGGGVKYPPGTLAVQRNWARSGEIDGDNMEAQTQGISIAVEKGAPTPYPPAVGDAIAAFCKALASEAPLHPDCVMGMGEVPYAHEWQRAAAEQELAERARLDVPIPQTDLTLELERNGKSVRVDVELRDTNPGLQTGMMLRRGFDGENRGMLFVYPHARYLKFFMRNCHIPIDVAYVRKQGRRYVIDEVRTMAPQAGHHGPFTHYKSRGTSKYALEMPGGWFEKHGWTAGTVVRGLPK